MYEKLIVEPWLKGTLPPLKKLMNWHKSDVIRFRKYKNRYLPNFAEKYSRVFEIFDFKFTVPVTS